MTYETAAAAGRSTDHLPQDAARPATAAQADGAAGSGGPTGSGRPRADPTGATSVSAASASSTEAADPYCLAPAESDRLLASAPWRRFAVVGDSLAEGLGDPSPGYRTASWADRTAEALRRIVPDLAYLNLGARGLTAAQVRAGQAERAARFRPDLVAVVCGGNDLLLPGFSAAVVERELDLLFSRLAGPGTTLLGFALANVAAAVPELRGSPLEEGVAVLNAVTRKVARRHGAGVVEMYVHPAVGDRDLYSADLVHASARGHAVIAAATVRTLAAGLPPEPVGESSAGPTAQASTGPGAEFSTGSD